MGLKSAIQKFASEMRTSEITKLELRGSGDPLNNPAIPLSTAGFLSWAFSGEPTAAGEQINVHTSLQQMTVYACIKVLSESVASLPVKVYEVLDGKGKKETTNHTLAELLGVAPNDEMTAFSFWEAMVGALALTGNCYAEIQRDAVGRPVALWPLNPLLTEPKRDSAGNLVYETTDGMQQGKFRVIASENVLHVPLFSFDGLKGINPIHLARQGIGLARAAEKFGGRWFGNGARPGGLLSNTGGSVPTPAQMTSMRESWERSQGGENQGTVAVLPGGWTYTPMGINPDDSQFLETRQFQRTEIAALFRVPPHMVGDNSKLSNSNAEQSALMFVTDTLRPYLSRLEAEIARKLLPRQGRNSGRYLVQFDVTERLRGDFSTTMTGYATGKQWGFLSTNDVRESLGQNPIGPEGDIYWSPVNMQNSARLLDTESTLDQTIGGPTPLPDAVPTTDERSMLERYSSAYITIYRDAFGRLLKRDKRDLSTITAIFTPVLTSIAEAAAGYANGSDAANSSKNIESVCRSMAKRAETYTEANIDALAQHEFIKAVRSIHILTHRDIAGAKAEASVTIPETVNE
ncbi:phage portal protein [Granulicella sp. dw_53]|uniref:phage portal protein n=1 Tax=Granulicella sp. dw_53 TaxID=2719792 RepID=UPI001BD4BE24|nr:phage portal protein [Granulicella sp. dw_53]